MKYQKGLVMLSGGQDSCTCLALACDQCDQIHTVSFDYGQRHIVELEYAEKLSRLAHAKSHWLICLDLSFLESALIDSDGDISSRHELNKQLPASFVPGRNLIFMASAGALLYQIQGDVLYGGMSQTDYSGYPDCRRSTVHSMHNALMRGMEYEFAMETPLMHRTKAETVLLMQVHGKIPWYEFTQTCYEGKRPPCGECPACKLRAKGFEEAGVKDPLLCL